MNEDRVIENKPTQVVIVEKFLKELEDNAENMRREEAVKQLQDIFIINRLATASRVETVRERALSALMSKVETMSPGLLLKTIETLSQVGEVDVGAITGTGPATKGGVNLYNVIHNKTAAIGGGSTAGSISSGEGGTSSSTVKDIGNLLEAITSIADNLHRNPKIIDATPEPDRIEHDPIL